MKSRFATCCALTGLLALGCETDKPAENAEAQPGAFRYVVAYDVETGKQTFGGAHAIDSFEAIEVEGGDSAKAEAINNANKPEKLHPALKKAAFRKYDPALTEGKSDWPVFPSSWFPQQNNGIADRWTLEKAPHDINYEDLSDPDTLSPAEKYDLLFNEGDPQDIAAVEHWPAEKLSLPVKERGKKHSHKAMTVVGPATAWELETHGIYREDGHPMDWEGHCNGWSSYTTGEMAGAPKRDIRVRAVSFGEVVECGKDEPGCVLFRMGDIEALMAELYFDDTITVAGERCKEPDEEARDEFGRPLDPACRDLNPGAFHIAAVGMLNRGAKHLVTGKEGKPAFVIDHAADIQVWNFPLVGYKINEQKEISREEAAELMGAKKYIFNKSAKKFAQIKMTYSMVSDAVPISELLKHAHDRKVPLEEVELNYILELNSRGTIVGGEWIDRPAAEVNNLEAHPDFFWMSRSHVGIDEDFDDDFGENDNPFMSYSPVRALLDCANDPSTCAR